MSRETNDVRQHSLRDRRRAETVAEIKAAALARLTEGDGEELSLRAVARDIGVSVQALYHYFDSRDALITALIADAFEQLARAVSEAGAAGGSARERIVASCLAYRRWALDNRGGFQLAFGVPLPDYAAPEEGPTTHAAVQLGTAFRDVVFGSWTEAELAGLSMAVPLPGLDFELTGKDMGGAPLPPAAAALFIGGWATLHGFVVLETNGHLPWVDTGGVEDLCRVLVHSYVDQLERARTAAAQPLGVAADSADGSAPPPTTSTGTGPTAMLTPGAAGDTSP